MIVSKISVPLNSWTLFSNRLTENYDKVSDNNHVFGWDIITHPCPNFSGGLAKPPLKLGHGWVIKFRSFIWMLLYLSVAWDLYEVHGTHFTNTLQWHHNGCDGLSNHRPLDRLPNRLFRHRSKNTSKLRVTNLCGRNSPVTGEFPAQKASNSENVSIWWRHHEFGSS